MFHKKNRSIEDSHILLSMCVAVVDVGGGESGTRKYSCLFHAAWTINWLYIWCSAKERWIEIYVKGWLEKTHFLLIGFAFLCNTRELSLNTREREHKVSEAGTKTTEVDLASKLRISITRSEIYWLHWNPLSIINKFSSVVIFGSKIIKTSRDETINSLIIAVRALSIQFQFESAFFLCHTQAIFRPFLLLLSVCLQGGEKCQVFAVKMRISILWSNKFNQKCCSYHCRSYREKKS